MTIINPDGEEAIGVDLFDGEDVIIEKFFKSKLKLFLEINKKENEKEGKSI